MIGILEALRARIAYGLAPSYMKEAPFGVTTAISPGGEGKKVGILDLLTGYSEFPWLRAVVSKIAEVAAATQWFAFVEERGEVIELQDHPVLEFLTGGNELFSGYDIHRLLYAHLLITGEVFWAIERNGMGMPISAWPVPPHWMHKIPMDPLGMYEIRYRQLQVEAPGSEIAFYREVDPANPYSRGSGIAATASDELETDDHAAKYVKSFFLNRARPDILVTAKSDAPASKFTKDQATQLEEKWLQKVQGFMRQHKPLFLPGAPVDVKELGKSFSENQVVDLRKFSRDAVLQMYGLPPEALGILESSNRSTIESAELFLTKHVVLPKLIGLQSFLNMRIAPEFDDRLRIGFVSPVQDDKEHILNVSKAHSYAFTINELREQAGAEPLPDERGDLFPVPFNLTFTSDPSEVSAELGTAPPQEESVKVSKTLEPGQVDEFLAFFDDGGLQRSIFDLVERNLEDAVFLVGERLMRLVGQDIAFQRTTEIEEHLRDFGATRVRNVNEVTQRQLGARLSRGFSEGLRTREELSGVISGYFSDFGPFRARRIAQTELTRTLGFTSQQVLEQARVEEKMWLTTRDDAVRDSHADLDGVVVPKGQDFVTDGASAPFPGEFGVPELDINCRCALQPFFRGQRAPNTAIAWKLADQERRPLDRRMARALRTAFRRQRDALVRRLAEF